MKSDMTAGAGDAHIHGPERSKPLIPAQWKSRARVASGALYRNAAHVRVKHFRTCVALRRGRSNPLMP